MSEKFTLEVISPDRTILKVDAIEVVIPSYEGEIGILKYHIPLITFLRPGLIKINQLLNEAEKKISHDKITDKEKYLLSYKIETLKNINK